MKKKIDLNMKPTQILALGFLVIILIGAFFLSLPIATKDGHSVGYMDALFTATSSVCVTGLMTLDVANTWNLFGKIVILVLIQIGGLGFMTLTTTFFILLGKKISFKDRLIIQEAMNQYTISGVVRLIKNVVIGTFLIEGIGMIFLSVRFIPEFGFWKGLFMGLFHSVSAFCNAGIDILSGDSFSAYVSDGVVNFTLMALIFLGGLGFSVWLDILKNVREARQQKYSIRKCFLKMSLQTKLVLTISFLLTTVGAVFIFLVEHTNPQTMGQLSFIDKIIASLFHSISVRTAGINTISVTGLKDTSKFVLMILMFIGGSPASAAGGIKTVTFGVLLLTVISVIKGKTHVEAFHRRIPPDIIKKAISIIVISMSVIISVTMILSLTQSGDFLSLMFESVAGFSTAGYTLGITERLDIIGKIVMCITMFIGRIGPVSMMVALALRSRNMPNATITLPEERIIVG